MKIPKHHRCFRSVVVILMAGLLGFGTLNFPPSTPPVLRFNGAEASLLATGLPPLVNASVSLAHGLGPADGHALACSGAELGEYRCSAGPLDRGGSDPQSPSWTNLSGPVAPPRSSYAAMTYDAADRYVVLFGGLSATAYPLDETWTFVNGSWTNITSTAGVAPVARSFMAMTYDAADGYVLAFGGSSFAACTSSGSSTCNDTWSFLHGKWNKIPATPPYDYSGESVNRFSMTYDVADSYVLATDGMDTWRYSAGVWSSFCGSNCTNFIPGPDLEGTVAYDASDGYVVFFGSAPCNACAPAYIQGSYTWKFSGGTWTNITATAGTPPPSRVYSSLTSDSSTGGVLLFGGLTNNGSTGFLCLNDTWTFADGVWSQFSTSPSPPGVYAAGVAYDTYESLLVLFGGDSAIGSAGNLNDTWVWGTSPPIGELSLAVVPSRPVPGLNASFSVTFAGGVAPFTYYWSFGDGGSSSAENPTHAFQSEGFFEVRIWVNDSAGHSVNDSLRVHAYTPLSVSSIEADPNPALLGEAVSFTANATGGTPPYTYSWAFGDGGIGGNLSTITHAYSTDGPFEAEVTVSDAARAVAHGLLNVTIELQALAGSTTTSGESPLTVNFVGQAQGGVPPYRFDWAFGDGTTSASQDPRHTYDSSGQFIVVLTVTDSKNNVSASSISIQVASPKAGGLPASDWMDAVVLVGAACIAAVLGATIVRRRRHSREGERWVEELTAGEEEQAETSRRGPR